MARRKKSPGFYKIVTTGTEDMGTIGDQQYLGSVTRVDPALRGCYVNNVVVTCQANQTDENAASPAFTVYLSNNGAVGAGGLGWDDDAVITARSTGAGGGTVSLKANRRVKVTTFSNVGFSELGPVHIWAEMTAIENQSTQSARFTIEAWGKLHKFDSDIA